MSTAAIGVVVQFSAHLISCGKQPIKREDKFLISQSSCNDSWEGGDDNDDSFAEYK